MRVLRKYLGLWVQGRVRGFGFIGFRRLGGPGVWLETELGFSENC